MNSTASQSSNSGWLGASLWVPKSSGVATRPVPKYACHIRLTNTRAVVGALGSTSHFAKVRRVGGASAGSGWSDLGTPAPTGSAGLRKSPRLRRLVVLGWAFAWRTSVVVPAGWPFQRASIRSLASFHSGTVVRQYEKSAAIWAVVRIPRGMARTSRTRTGKGLAVGSGASVTEMRKRPRLLVWRSSLFQPPCSWARTNVSSVPPLRSMGVSATKTASRGTLRRPGPASMPQAVSTLPSIAKATGPTMRLRSVRSSKFGSRGDSGCSKSADALAILTFSAFFLLLRVASTGEDWTSNSVKAQVPLKERPGPLAGRFGSFSSSSRKAVILGRSTFTVILPLCLVGA